MKVYFIILGLAIILSGAVPGHSAELKKKVIFYHDGIPSYAGTYPSPGLCKVDLKDKKEGIASVRFMWNEPKGKWCGGEIAGVHPKDLSAFKEAGAVKFWIKSETDEKEIRIGFTDKNGYAIFKPLKLYTEKVTPQWQEIAIPLAGFSNTGSHWDENLGKRILKPFCWEQVTGFGIDIGAADGRRHVIYLDHVEVVGL